MERNIFILWKLSSLELIKANKCIFLISFFHATKIWNPWITVFYVIYYLPNSQYHIFKFVFYSLWIKTFIVQNIHTSRPQYKPNLQQNLSNTYLATYYWRMIYFHRSFKICCKLVVERNVFVIWLLFIQPHFLEELFVRSANNKHMSNKTSRLHGGFNDKLLTFCKSLWLRCILQVLLASPTLRYCYQRQFVKEKMSSIYFGKIYSQAI